MFIIAEFGSSPAADSWPLGEWCYAVQQTGADAVKVQLFRAGHFPEAEQDAKHLLAFPRHLLADFVDTAHYCDLRAGASVFDMDAVRLAAWHCDFLKLAAREQYNKSLTGAVLNKPLVVYRSISEFTAYHSASRVITLFTVQRYPLPMAHALTAVLRAALWFRAHGVHWWGWSSHSAGALDCVLAARLGAQAIEKHFALSSDDVEAGHSLQPEAFRRMVEAIKSRSQL